MGFWGFRTVFLFFPLAAERAFAAPARLGVLPLFLAPGRLLRCVRSAEAMAFARAFFERLLFVDFLRAAIVQHSTDEHDTLVPRSAPARVMKTATPHGPGVFLSWDEPRSTRHSVTEGV
ncbi:MAG TPA: hypothetical protein VEH77_02850 [Roseiarcus sp.]|nr:hypothetical protein [Roseiarcus sp.]